jgi:two-component system cell cycle response regulator
MKKKKQILVFEKNQEVLKFLKSFFRSRDDYAVYFIETRNALMKKITEKIPDALIVDSPTGIRDIKPSQVKCPIIALISTKITSGIRLAVEYDVECYLLSPFQEDELDYKLNLMIDKKNCIESIYMEKKDLKALIDLTYLISSTLKPQEVLYLIVKRLSKAINVTRCSIISIGTDNKRHATVISTFEDPKITKMKLDLKKYPEIRKALSSKRPVVIKDALKEPLMAEVRNWIEPIGIRSIVVVPVMLHDEVIGTLFLRTSKAGHAFTEREIQLSITFANASSNILYNAFLYERLKKEKNKLERLAITDYLTGIYNIRYFYNRLEEEFSRSMRYGVPLCCIMFDIDHFKKINDTYGHRVGDIVLREFAQLIKKRTRRSDVLARYGGEEFILLLPQTSLEGAIIRAERLRKVVKEYSFKVLKGSGEITVSIGIACSSDKKVKTDDDLINFADNVLFKAKNKGRDQIAVHHSP